MILALFIIIGLVGSIAAIQVMDKYERDLLIQQRNDLTQQIQDIANEFKQTHVSDKLYLYCLYVQIKENNDNSVGIYYEHSSWSPTFDGCMEDNFPSLINEIDRINDEIRTKQALINDLG